MPEESLDFHLLSQITLFANSNTMLSIARLQTPATFEISAIFVQRPKNPGDEVAPELAQPTFARSGMGQ